MEHKTNVNFAYHAPETLSDALKLKNEYGANAAILAGGTDLVPKIKALAATPDHVISLGNVTELDFIDFREEYVCIGAMRRLYEIETDATVPKKVPLLAEAIHTMSNTQIRNMSTLTGNVCNAIPSADTAPALLVLNASVKAVSVNGERMIPLEDFFTGVCRTCLAPEEIVTEIHVPYAPENATCIYRKETVRRALDLAIVGVAGCVVVENGVCTDCRLALGAVATTPKRAKTAESMLIGKTLTEELVNEAAVAASVEDCLPISDIRATKEYRVELVRLATRDIVLAAMKA